MPAADAAFVTGLKAVATDEPTLDNHRDEVVHAAAMRPPTAVAMDVNAVDACAAPCLARRASLVRPDTSDTARSSPPTEVVRLVNDERAAVVSVNPWRSCAKSPPELDVAAEVAAVAADCAARSDSWAVVRRAVAA